jgi:SSS family solute:Na+ symporter
VAGIGVFLLFYGLWYKPEGALWDYLTLTGTIYLASISILLIACCYWPRANSWGAAAAIVISAALPIAFLVMQKNESTRQLAKQIGPHYSGIAAFVGSALAMVVGSLLKPQNR